MFKIYILISEILDFILFKTDQEEDETETTFRIHSHKDVYSMGVD